MNNGSNTTRRNVLITIIIRAPMENKRIQIFFLDPPPLGSVGIPFPLEQADQRKNKDDITSKLLLKVVISLGNRPNSRSIRAQSRALCGGKQIFERKTTSFLLSYHFFSSQTWSATILRVSFCCAGATCNHAQQQELTCYIFTTKDIAFRYFH